MKIIIPPAKKMNTDTDTFPPRGLPPLLDDTTILMEWLRCLTLDEAQSLWQCNEKIAQLNYQRLQEMDLRRNLTPALISYEGIQYQYMAPEVFTRKEWNYVQEHLRILSGFYGVLKPLDGVVPYRLEMQAKVKVNGTKNLYEFWDSKLYEEIHIPGQVILNLASKEYSKCIEKYLHPKDTFITCIFGEWKNNKVIQKGTMAKMARGEMVRFMASKGIVNVEDIREFEGLGYHFEEALSDGENYIFLPKKGEPENEQIQRT
ncbi:MAG: peroxide stress protein YaaA [Lachnospiraceae bacterium]|nr:peroxide stress protein YaaA [Lachnospiraceae bacterium]